MPARTTGCCSVVGKRMIFDIGGNKYRLIVRVSYTHGRVLVKFVGTRAVYDMVDPETVNGPTQHQQ